MEVNSASIDAELNVSIALCEYYTKLLSFYENYGNEQYIQESTLKDKWNQFKEDSKAPIKGRDDESIVKRIFMFIPRVLNAIIQAIRRLFNRNDVNELKHDMDDLKQKMDNLEKSNEKNAENIKVLAKHILSLHNQLTDGMNLSDTRYDTIHKSINTMYDEMKKLNIIKADKSVQNEQIRSVLVLAGYVLYTFDIKAYEKFLHEFDNTLHQMDEVSIDSVSEVSDFSKFNISNINIDLDEHRGHFIYSIEDFEKYSKNIQSLNDKVSKHCQDLIKKFNEMNRKMKFRRNSEEKTSSLRNINEFSKRLTDIMKKLNNTQKWYTEDFNKIKKSIDENRSYITALSSSDDNNDSDNPFKKYMRSDTMFRYNEKEGDTLPDDARNKLVSILKVLLKTKPNSDFNTYKKNLEDLMDLLHLPHDRVVKNVGSIDILNDPIYVLIQIGHADKLVSSAKAGTVLYHTSNKAGLTSLEPRFVSGSYEDFDDGGKYFSLEALFPNGRVYFYKDKPGTRFGGHVDKVNEGTYVYKYVMKPGDKFYVDQELHGDAGFLVSDKPIPVEDVTDQFR